MCFLESNLINPLNAEDKLGHQNDIYFLAQMF